MATAVKRERRTFALRLAKRRRSKRNSGMIKTIHPQPTGSSAATEKRVSVQID
jgi:hypothetical protein